MSGVRHRDAPVIPTGPAAFAPDLRHFLGDLALSARGSVPRANNALALDALVCLLH